MLASHWNIPWFGFVGQSPKLDNADLYDTYVKLVSPLQRIGEVLHKSLQYFGWKYVGLFGGSSDASTWEKMDELWTSVENQLKVNITITAKVRYNTKDPTLHRENLKYILSVARSKFQFKSVLYCLALKGLHVEVCQIQMNEKLLQHITCINLEAYLV